jgi:predicted AlkP superfamily pyrophosphatase or phosphodiesterase
MDSKIVWARLERAFLAGAFGILSVGAASACAQTAAKVNSPKHPKLVVLLVVDQMRGDYVDKFQGQWNGGLKRLVEEGAWFRAAAYPYAATETCVGHSTISTGAFPADHGMVANAWWDREQQQIVTCTGDPNVKNMAYAGGTTAGGDSAVRMMIPSFAEELKFQTGGGTRVVSFSLKARAAITMAGHEGDAVAWFDSEHGVWVTSSAYGTVPMVEDFVKKNPVARDFGKTWALSLPPTAYRYDEKIMGADAVEGWEVGFPHVLHAKEGSTHPDEQFYAEWESSPFAETYLTKMAEEAVDSLGLGQGGATDFLAVSYSSVDHVGHVYGPRSWEVQDILVRLDKDLGELFAHLDAKVGRGNYVVALTADHGVAPIPADMRITGVQASVLVLSDVEAQIEKALEPFNLAKPAVARITGNQVYFASGIYEQLKQNAAAMHAVVAAITKLPGVAAVYTTEDLGNGTTPIAATRSAAVYSYFAGRSGDLFVLQRPYWLLESTANGGKPHLGAGHGSPYYYDQHVPVMFMGFGIQPGEYFDPATPADIAPTFGALCGVTLATRDGRVLSEALRKK